MGCELPNTLQGWAAFCDCLEKYEQEQGVNKEQKEVSDQEDMEKKVEMKPNRKRSDDQQTEIKRHYRPRRTKAAPQVPSGQLKMIKTHSYEKEVSDLSDPPQDPVTNEDIAVIPLDQDAEVRANYERFSDPFFRETLKTRKAEPMYRRRPSPNRRNEIQQQQMRRHKRFFIDEEDHRDFMKY